MADYDVQALGLASPPAAAPATTYYPGVLVRNNGVHPANVTGFIRQYNQSTGMLLNTFTVARNNLLPGATATVSSAAPLVWTPADIGKKFLFNGYVTAPLDSVPANNYFGPVLITVTGATPPPPPIQEHHTQHENGGADELTLEGLSGKLAEHQDPTEHASDHQDGGTDQLSVDGLAGELAEPQTPKTHATSHEPGGTDPITGLTPGVHASTHAPGGSDSINASYQQLTDKGAADGYASLDATALVPKTELPTDVQYTGDKGAANGYAELDANKELPEYNAAPRTDLVLSGAGVEQAPFVLLPGQSCAAVSASNIPARLRVSSVGGFVSCRLTVPDNATEVYVELEVVISDDTPTYTTVQQWLHLSFPAPDTFDRQFALCQPFRVPCPNVDSQHRNVSAFLYNRSATDTVTVQWTGREVTVAQKPYSGN